MMGYLIEITIMLLLFLTFAEMCQLDFCTCAALCIMFYDIRTLSALSPWYCIYNSSLLHRELIDVMAGSLFQDKAQLVKFIRHSHTICFVRNNKSAYKLLDSMSASKNNAERTLEEVGMNGFCCALSLSNVVCND